MRIPHLTVWAATWLIGIIFASPVPSVSAAVIRTFLIGGQSNADGRAAAADLPLELQAPQTDVYFYYASNVGVTTLAPITAAQFTRFGPEITFGDSMQQFYEPSGDSVAILKYARGATNLHTDWAAGGDATTTGDGTRYIEFQQTIASGLAALQAARPDDTILIEGMLWVQGEQDITDARPGGPTPSAVTDYEENLARLIMDVRVTFAADMEFYFTQISENQTVFSNPADSDYPAYLELRAQQNSADANIAGTIMLNIDGSEFTMTVDNLHFDAAGQQALGNAFATAVQTVPEASTASLALVAIVLLLGSRNIPIPTKNAPTRC